MELLGQRPLRSSTLKLYDFSIQWSERPFRSDKSLTNVHIE